MTNDQAYYVIHWKHVRLLALAVALALVALVSISGTDADLPQDKSPFASDGRINVVHHFGGDVLYCVNEDLAPTNEFFTTTDGGMQVLNINGQLLWFVEAEVILEKVAAAEPGGGNVLVAEGTGTYGPVALYTYKPDAETVRFIFVGMDEHGKTNQIDFEGCTPVNPPAGTPELCTTAEVNESLESFFQCYALACPGIPIAEGESCFCSQYPNSNPCGGGPR
jgi:hypothetical protein